MEPPSCQIFLNPGREPVFRSVPHLLKQNTNQIPVRFSRGLSLYSYLEKAKICGNTRVQIWSKNFFGGETEKRASLESHAYSV